MKYALFLEFEELPTSHGVLMDNTDDDMYSEQWVDSEPKDDPTYTPSIVDSSQPSEAGSGWSSQKQSVSAEHLYYASSVYLFQQFGSTDDPIKCSKLFVFIPLLLVLFDVCRQPGCGNNVDRANIVCSRKGACLTITATCDSHHVTKVFIFIPIFA